MNWKLWGSALTAAILFSLLIVANLRANQSLQGLSITMATTATAMSFGWLLGIVLAPYGKNETAMFSSFGAGIATFFTGYLASKLGGMIDKLSEAMPHLLHDPEGIIRLLTSLTAMMTTLIITFVFRRYAKIDDQKT